MKSFIRKIKFKACLLGVPTLLTTFIATPGSAAKKRSSSDQSVYSAYEPDPQAMPADSVAPIPVPAKPVTAVATQPTSTKNTLQKNSSQVGTPVPRPMPTALYDGVPANQTAAILLRLKTVEVLVERYGRAYDYRTHTLKELQGILEQLDQAQNPKPPEPPVQTPPALPPFPSE